jgi:hypothetical protein
MDIGLPGPKEQLWKLLLEITSEKLLQKALYFNRSAEGIKQFRTDIEEDLVIFAEKISELFKLPDPIDEPNLIDK